MNRLPQKKKRGDPILAEDWNTLLDAIAARTPRPGAGLELIASSGGFAYSQPSSLIIPRQSLPPFSVIGIEKDAGVFQVTVKEGWVIERRPKSGDSPAVKFHMPKSDETTLDTVPRPKIPMSLGDTLWCKYQTDVMGEVIEVPEVIVAAADQDGTHYQPEDPEGSGQAGTFYVKLFKLEDDGGTPAVKVYQQSDIEHWGQLWTGQNLGSGARVYNEHTQTENRFKFRSLIGLAGIKVEENGDEIEVSSEGANLNLRIFSLQYDNDGHLYGEPYLEATLYFRGGRYVGDQDPDDGNPPAQLDTYDVFRLQNAA